MIRASQASRICTNKPVFDSKLFEQKEKELSLKVKAKLKEEYHISKLETYSETAGLKTVAKEFSTFLEKRRLFETDPLPPGGKTYLQELWLENNYSFYSFSLKETDFALRKGNIVEDAAIDLVSNYYDIQLKKNTHRVEKDFITGECDVLYNNTVRDIKCPQDWKSFRKKTGIETDYYWQLIAYCYLYNTEQAFLDYVLMNIPQDLVSVYTRGFTDQEFEKFLMSEHQISLLSPNQRLKSFKLEADIFSDINFLVSRIEKARLYYESLTYEQCMKML